MAQNTTVRAHNKTTALISIIVPVFNEGEIINDLVGHVKGFSKEEPVEIIVADGGPGHKTLAVIDDPCVIRVKSLAGRGTQMNSGAAMASGDILVFLHADTRLPQGALNSIRRALAGSVRAGAFSLSIESARWSLAVIAYFANVRSRVERVPYGDQGQFMTADLFREVCGFADISIMEDVELFCRIRRMGLPIVILHDMVLTSPRRWEAEGILRRTLTNWWLRIRYRFGVSPEKLKRQYRPHGGEVDDI
jgi:rSAM/selenodomain-associated transferase 2